MTIRRAFADLAFGQVHYRTGGSGRPLLMLHAGPGSARQLVPLIADLMPGYKVIAPDMPGNGDSAPLPVAEPAIADYAAAAIDLLDVLGIDEVDVYGSHTGASIAVDLAILAPGRVGRLVLDGLGVFPPVLRDTLLASYAMPFVPDLDGAYLMRAFHFLRDQYLFFPWFDRTRAARRDAGSRPAPELHAWLVELLKAGETYHHGYRAAFTWDAESRLPLLSRPTLVVSGEDDPLFDASVEATGLIPGGRFATLPQGDAPGFAAARRDLILRFSATPFPRPERPVSRLADKRRLRLVAS